MRTRCRSELLACSFLLLLSAGFLSPVAAEESAIEFSPERWDLSQAKIVDHLGRKALVGAAVLKDVAFQDGVIDFDMAVTGARTYAGVVFRAQDGGNAERAYIRPHRAGRVAPPLYSDVVQYVPMWNAVDSWQLYNGDGYTAPAWVPAGEWFHVRLEVKGTQARVFVGGTDSPALLIHELARGRSVGAVGLVGLQDGAAFFSNVSVRAADDLRFAPPPRRDDPPGVIRDWKISRPFPALRVDLEKTPAEQGLVDLAWKDVTAELSGLVDVSRHHPRSGQPDCVFARAVLKADRPRTFKLNLGYSDAVAVFLNGKLVFSANGAYQSRDPSFLGIAGFFDTVHLPLARGENELLLAVVETMGGWGFMAQDGDAVFRDGGVRDAWETGREFSIPESAAYDPDSESLYVSNWDGYDRSAEAGKQFVSKVGLDGRVKALRWVEGLRNPTGLAVHAGRLYAVERAALVEIDVVAERISSRYPVPGAMGLNDVAVGADGTVFLSDMRGGALFRYSDGRFEKWLEGPQIERPNGVLVDGPRVVWGNGDGCLKAADLATKKIEVVARLGRGGIDGIASDGRGNLLVSHYEGRLFRVAPTGEVVKLLDTTAPGYYIADFTFVPEKRLLVAPGFFGSRVRAWTIE